LRDKLYLWLFNAFRAMVRRSSPKIYGPIFSILGSVLPFIDRKHAKIAMINLDFAFGDSLSKTEKKKIIKGCYENLLFNLADFVKNQGIDKKELLSKVEFENESIVEDAIKRGEKIVFITAHYGNWELLPLAVAARFGPLTGVGRKLDSKPMNEILKRNREQYDIRVLDKKGAMKGLISDMKEGRMVGLLVDQNTAEKEGVLIEFFGKKARHTPSASLLARRFNAKIIPAFITSEDRIRYKIRFYDPILCEKSEDQQSDILACTQKQADITEKVIREKPSEWFWFHKRWKNQYEEIYEKGLK